MENDFFSSLFSTDTAPSLFSVGNDGLNTLNSFDGVGSIGNSMLFDAANDPMGAAINSTIADTPQIGFDTVSIADNIISKTSKKDDDDWSKSLFGSLDKASKNAGNIGMLAKGVGGIYDAYSQNKFKQQIFNQDMNRVNKAEERRAKAEQSFADAFANSKLSKL